VYIVADRHSVDSYGRACVHCVGEQDQYNWLNDVDSHRALTSRL